MSVHLSSLPLEIDPLIAEAKRRARRRWFLIIAAVLALVAAGTSFALRPAGGPGVSSPRPVPVSRVGVSLGSQGPVVAAWQRVLNDWLLASGDHWPRAARARVGHIRVNGVFDHATTVATRFWQRDAYQRPTGVVTHRSWMLWIGGHITCCGTGLPYFTAQRLHTIGVFPDPYVGWWQNALNHWRLRHHLSPVIVDGVYSTKTRAATRVFQRSVGLRPTGVATLATWLKAQHIRNMLAFP